MLLEHDETRPRGRRMTATRQHLAHLLKYHPRQPYAPSLIKSRFFSLTTTLLTVLTFLHFETPRVLASGPKNARDIVRKWTPREKYDKYQHFLTNFGLLLSVECSDEVSRKSVEFAYPIIIIIIIIIIIMILIIINIIYIAHILVKLVNF